MNELTRRGALQLGAGAAAASALLATTTRAAHAAVDLRFSPEPGAALEVLRWDAFVPGEEVAWSEMTKQFCEQTGVAVSLESVPWPSVQGRTSEAVQAGSGPDIIFGFYDTPQLYPDQMVDLTILATYLGEKYGGWYPVCQRYGTVAARWIALPLATAGTSMVYVRPGGKRGKHPRGSGRPGREAGRGDLQPGSLVTAATAVTRPGCRPVREASVARYRSWWSALC